MALFGSSFVMGVAFQCMVRLTVYAMSYELYVVECCGTDRPVSVGCRLAQMRFSCEMDCEIDCNNDSERKVFTTISSPHETSTIQYALLQHALTRL
jgi:hypothetical protein